MIFTKFVTTDEWLSIMPRFYDDGNRKHFFRHIFKYTFIMKSTCYLRFGTRLAWFAQVIVGQVMKIQKHIHIFEEMLPDFGITKT